MRQRIIIQEKRSPSKFYALKYILLIRINKCLQPPVNRNIALIYDFKNRIIDLVFIEIRELLRSILMIQSNTKFY